MDTINLTAIKEGRAGHCYGNNDEFAISYVPIRCGVYNIYLYGNIESANQFIPALEVLQQAGENDVIVIHLSTNGGSLEATDTFIDAMRTCEARIIVRGTGGIHSAGTLIILQADEFTLSDNAHFLIHNGSLGSGGKFSDWKSESRHMESYMDRVMRNNYKGFLSELEIENLLKGQDIWLDGDEFAARWEVRNEAIAARVEASSDPVLRNLLAQVKEAVAEAVEDENAPPVAKKRKPKASKAV